MDGRVLSFFLLSGRLFGSARQLIEDPCNLARGIYRSMVGTSGRRLIRVRLRFRGIHVSEPLLVVVRFWPLLRNFAFFGLFCPALKRFNISGPMRFGEWIGADLFGIEYY